MNLLRTVGLIIIGFCSGQVFQYGHTELAIALFVAGVCIIISTHYPKRD